MQFGFSARLAASCWALFDLNSNHPHDYWAAALGANCLFAAICLYLYDVLDGRGWTLGMVLGALALISIGLTDSWTHDFRAAQVIVTESSPPQGAVRAVPQTQQDQVPKSPHLEQPTFPENSQIIHLTLGNWTVTIPRTSLETGPPFRLRDQIVSVPPVGPDATISMKNGTIYVDAIVSDGTKFNREVIIQHNTILDWPPRWDHNSNQHALEFVDEHRSPVFQLIIKGPTDLEMNGRFVTPGGVTILSPTLGLMVNAGASAASAPATADLVPIFKYPSWKYPGQYAEK